MFLGSFLSGFLGLLSLLGSLLYWFLGSFLSGFLGLLDDLFSLLGNLLSLLGLLGLLDDLLGLLDSLLSLVDLSLQFLDQFAWAGLDLDTGLLNLDGVFLDGLLDLLGDLQFLNDLFND